MFRFTHYGKLLQSFVHLYDLFFVIERMKSLSLLNFHVVRQQGKALHQSFYTLGRNFSTSACNSKLYSGKFQLKHLVQLLKHLTLLI